MLRAWSWVRHRGERHGIQSRNRDANGPTKRPRLRCLVELNESCLLARHVHRVADENRTIQMGRQL